VAEDVDAGLGVGPVAAQQSTEKTTLLALTGQGFEVRATTGREGSMLILQKGKDIYLCNIVGAVLGPIFKEEMKPSPCYRIQ
jgi:hypothetical protein